MLLVNFVPVYAFETANEVTEQDVEEFIKTSKPSIQDKFINMISDEKNQAKSGEDSYKIAINGESKLINEKTYKTLQNEVYKADQTKKVQNDIKNLTAGEYALKADLNAGADFLSGIKPVINTILGILAYIVIMAMGLFTATDIAYMTIPIFRTTVNNKASEGGMMMARTDNKTGENKPRLVTDDAIYAVNTCTIENGKSPFMTYLKRRIVAWIACAIVIYILLTGNISIIVNLALKVVEGVLDVISGLGV